MTGQNFKLINSDAFHAVSSLEDSSIQCVFSSLSNLPCMRDAIPWEQKIKSIIPIFRELEKKLRSDGLVFLLIDNPYFGLHKTGKAEQVRYCPGQLSGAPWRIVQALQEDGWIWRSDIIVNTGSKKSSVCPDRFFRSHVYLFMLCHNEKYYFDQQGSRISSFWDFSKTKKGLGWFYETAKTCILHSTKVGETVLDFCCGDGITGMAALKNGRRFIGAESSMRELEAAYNTLSNIEPDVPLEPIQLEACGLDKEDHQLSLFSEDERGLHYANQC